MAESIYGIKYETPRLPSLRDIDGFGVEKKKQKFRRVEYEELFEDLEYNEDDEPLYNSKQLAFIDRELDRIEHGYWFINFGLPTYITGLHYFYLNYWTLENGEQPEYRDCDRRYFYFQDYCEKQPHIDGIIRSKKRREGATSQGTADLVKTAIMEKNAFCGLVSKTGADAKDAFLKMIRPGFNKVPPFLKPRVEDEDSKTEIFLIRPKKKPGKKKTTTTKGLKTSDLGHGSKIDYKPTQLNSYDSGRLRKLLKDESGKDPVDVPINEYWPIVRQTLKQGGRKVGFALIPSTSNKLSKGGRGFKKLWDESDHFRSKITGSGLYRYFNPAYDGYVPYIDEYGMSILGQPTREQVKWMKEHYGATDEQTKMSVKEWILFERSLIKDEDARREHIRMYPFTEKEAFDYEDGQNIYDLEAILNQKQWLQDNPVRLRQVTFFLHDDGTADFRDDPKGMWWIWKLPEDYERNATVEINGKAKPANSAKYVLTADPFKNTITTGPGSKGCGIIGSKINPLDTENTGLPMAFFYGRPRLRRDFHKQMLYGAMYYGAEMCYESDYDDYIEFLMEEKKMGYAKEKPVNTIDPSRKTKANPAQKQYGIKSADGFSYALMIDRSQAYVILYCYKIIFPIILDQLEEYDPDKRTEFDAAVAFQLFCVAISDPVKPKKVEEPRKTPVVRTFNLNKQVS